MDKKRTAHCEYVDGDNCWLAWASVSYDGYGHYNMEIDPDTVMFNDEDYIGKLPDHVKEGLIDSIDVMRLFKKED